MNTPVSTSPTIKAPDVLYKYRCFKKNDLAILKNKLIFFAKPDSFNDPFDCLIPIRFDLLSEAEYDQRSILALHKISNDTKNADLRPNHIPVGLSGEAVNRYYFDHVKSNSKFNQYSPAELDRMMKWQLDHLRENVTVYSLAEKCDDVLMWSHYSSNHAGFCVGFDTELLRKSTMAGVGRVEYDEPPKLKPITDDRYHIAQVLSKAKNWGYEQEWRFVHWQKKNQFIIDPACIKEIILGCCITARNKKLIIRIVRGDPTLKHVKILQADKIPFSFTLSLTPVP